MTSSHVKESATAKPAIQPPINVIITEDHVAVMDPPVPLLEPHLQYRSRSFVLGGPTGVEEQVNEITLCDFDQKGRLAFLSGLLPRMRQVLREHGYRVRVDDRSNTRPPLFIDTDVLDGYDQQDVDLIEAMVQNPLGQIQVQRCDDAIDKCVLIGRAFPKARIVVAVATRKQAWKLQRRLHSGLKKSVGIHVAGIRGFQSRLLVGTFENLPRKLAGKFDILLLPYGDESTGDKAIDAIIAMDSPRCYAFIQPQRRRDRQVYLRLEQLAGRAIFLVTKPRVPVRVLMMPVPEHAVATGISALDRKRSLIWHNSIRNRRIAEVARAAEKRDISSLRRLGLRDQDMTVLHFRSPRVVVLVETPEQGRKLLALLPGWQMLDLVPENKTASTKRPTNREPIIVTLAFAATKRIRADVLIRATGTEFPMRLKGFPQRVNYRDENEALIIDFLDELDRQSETETRRRMDEYQRRGMTIVPISEDDV